MNFAIFTILVFTLLTRCYSTKQAWGQLRLLSLREPVEEVLKKPDLDQKTRERLLRVKVILEFASSEG